MHFPLTLPVSFGQSVDVKCEPFAPPIRKWVSSEFIISFAPKSLCLACNMNRLTPHGSRALFVLGHVPFHKDNPSSGTLDREHEILDFNRANVALYSDPDHDLGVKHVGEELWR